MKKLLILMLFVVLTGCGKKDENYSPDYKSQIDNNTNRISQLEDKVSSLEKNVDKNNEELDLITSAIDIIETNLDNLEHDLEKEIEEREGVDRILLSKIRKANRGRKQLSDRFERFKKYQEFVNRNQQKMNRSIFARIVNLERKMARGFTSLNKRIDELEDEDIAILEKSVGKIFSLLGQLGRSVGSLSHDLQSLKSEMTSFKASLIRLTNSYSGLSDTIDDINSAIREIEDAIEELQEEEGDNNHCQPFPFPPFFPCGGF